MDRLICLGSDDTLAAVASASSPGPCLNCGAVLTGPYCATCGQKQAHVDLTLRELLHDSLHELVHWEGRIPVTIKALFLRPGLLTRDFLAGRRARWLPPLRLYLICSVGFFLTGPLVERVTHRPARQMVHFGLTNRERSGPLTPQEREVIAAGIPARLFGVERLERAAMDNARLNRAVDAVFPKAMFVLLPMFALLTRAIWRRPRLRYPAHLYLALHLHAAWFGAFAFAKLAIGFIPSNRVAAIVGFLAVTYVLWYTAAAVYRVFGDSRPTTAFKALALFTLYAFCFFPVSLALLAYALWTI